MMCQSEVYKHINAMNNKWIVNMMTCQKLNIDLGVSGSFVLNGGEVRGRRKHIHLSLILL